MSRAANILHQCLPEPGLPAGVGVQGFFFAPGGNHDLPPLFPGAEPIGAKDLILVEQVGDFFRQLKAAQFRVMAFQKPAQGQEGVVGMDQFRQQPVKSPYQPAFIKGRRFRYLALW